MKLGVLTVLYQDQPLETVLDHVAEMGLQAVELGTGGWPGDHHCRAKDLVKDQKAAKELRRSVEERGLFISALSCHGNPLHPMPTSLLTTIGSTGTPSLWQLSWRCR